MQRARGLHVQGGALARAQRGQLAGVRALHERLQRAGQNLSAPPRNCEETGCMPCAMMY